MTLGVFEAFGIQEVAYAGLLTEKGFLGVVLCWRRYLFCGSYSRCRFPCYPPYTRRCILLARFLPALLKEQKETAPLDIRPLKAIFDELFAYLKSLRDLHSLGPTALFQQEVGQRLTSLRAQVEIRCQELNVPATAQDGTLTALSTLRGSIERTRSMLADLERQYDFQQQKFEEQSSRMQACQYSLSITENELRDFEAMLNEYLGADWQQ
ncbi:hypothetical protein MRB53_026024 [Persea americana]|uniref:Uncharacterized protein n=1 Tax=Persea americana TaxID=3435 RepID=A0ACC2LHP3_PERAE|nr:hypothetical protein MRB53_026024 [Persea americana]